MSAPPLVQSPRLDKLLSRLRSSLARQVWLNGLSSAVNTGLLWILFIYGADRLLHVPGPVRILNTLVLLALPAYMLRRHLLRPMRRLPDRAGLAMLIERYHVGSNDLLVSAVQLAPEATSSPARALIEGVVKEADERAGRFSTSAVIDARKPRRRALFALGSFTACCAIFLLQPGMAAIFFKRLLGADVAWPQLTTLRVEVPAIGDRLQVQDLGDEILVLAARGSDIPVLVRAEGVVPSEVTLNFNSGHQTVLASGGTTLFRTLLRSVQEDVSLYATGGDDEDSYPTVHVQVLQPPDVTRLTWEVQPPAYSGLPSRVSEETAIEVLQGSKLRVHIVTDPPEASGVARILPDDIEIELQRGPFPDDAAQGTVIGLNAALIADLSKRVTFELVDETGLPNPDPGLYAVTVVEDRRPELRLISPSRADLEVVPGGALPLRVRVEDDFGLSSLQWELHALSTSDEPLATGVIESIEVAAEWGEIGDSSRSLFRSRVRLELDQIVPGGLQPGSQLALHVIATDNREPLPNQSSSAPVRLQVVSSDEYLRHLKDKLARAGEQTSRVYELGEEQLSRARASLAGASDGPEEDDTLEIGALLNGLRRFEGDCRALSRDLCNLTGGLLYNRIDERATELLEAVDDSMAELFDRSFDPVPWARIAREYSEGRHGKAELAGDLIGIVEIALLISEEHSANAASAAVQLRDHSDPAKAAEGLKAAVSSLEQAQAELERLLGKLGEWDNFHSILTLTRDILSRQRNLKQRTQDFAEDN